ncbi:MAG: OB-fold nucleic acid binding domain-containing protein [Candidatus Pacearchaeota archaeon]|nr:OB-fold nucleic acid binding domain-containing protein [Candidatus Pacearchaeota archaeon]
MPEEFKRHIAHKLKISEILEGTPIVDGERFRFSEIRGKQVSRVNIIANIIDKYIQDEEKKFASITLDDASGQIKVKTFGEDIEKFNNFEQGDTIMLIGLLRQWNNEIYVLPEIITKKEAPYLLLRKLETDLEKQKTPQVQLSKSQATELKDKILTIIKREEERGGADISVITSELNSKSEIMNAEIKKLLEEGVIYEPRPGKVRYLG